MTKHKPLDNLLALLGCSWFLDHSCLSLPAQCMREVRENLTWENLTWRKSPRPFGRDLPWPVDKAHATWQSLGFLTLLTCPYLRSAWEAKENLTWENLTWPKSPRPFGRDLPLFGRSWFPAPSGLSLSAQCMRGKRDLTCPTSLRAFGRDLPCPAWQSGGLASPWSPLLS